MTEQLTHNQQGRVVVHPKAYSTPSPLPKISKQELLWTEQGSYAETAQSVLTVILRLVIDGLTSVILIALGTVNLTFQHRFVSIFLRPILRMMVGYVRLQSSHHSLSLHLAFQYLIDSSQDMARNII